jgi:hypothetical protein
MTTAEIVAQARQNRPADPPPSLIHVEQALRMLLNTLLSGFDYDAHVMSGPGVVCRALAAILSEVENVQRRKGH